MGKRSYNRPEHQVELLEALLHQNGPTGESVACANHDTRYSECFWKQSFQKHSLYNYSGVAEKSPSDTRAVGKPSQMESFWRQGLQMASGTEDSWSRISAENIGQGRK